MSETLTLKTSLGVSSLLVWVLKRREGWFFFVVGEEKSARLGARVEAQFDARPCVRAVGLDFRGIRLVFEQQAFGTLFSGFASSFVVRPCVLKHTPHQK